MYSTHEMTSQNIPFLAIAEIRFSPMRSHRAAVTPLHFSLQPPRIPKLTLLMFEVRV
nr:hypothetical protein [Nostoc sp. ChiSLP03a]MDZ8210765.1 hypothetical protein [Nostoc sp. ChiSLP03a]